MVIQFSVIKWQFFYKIQCFAVDATKSRKNPILAGSRSKINLALNTTLFRVNLFRSHIALFLRAGRGGTKRGKARKKEQNVQNGDGITYVYNVRFTHRSRSID